ncbi:MAG TPA: ABC-type transport auxiliary lipoprotein family protein [Steroidobacteraceae bacterium]|nr:ABC-type transport auxiliary lipoprotein family protein [Steroidobacteraceae bacterium]
MTARWSGVAQTASLLLLVGCSGLFQSKSKPEQIYYLRPPAATAGGNAASGTDAGSSAARDPAHAAASLRVGRPVAAPGLGTPHIMLVQADHRMNFYTGSRWPAPAPEMIEALTVETLRGSGEWSSVEDSASPFPSDYLLQIRLRRFEADYGAGPGKPVVQVQLDCIIGRREGREVVASFSAAGSAPAAANRVSDVVSAFEEATGTALESLSRQALQAARADAQHAAQNGASPPPSSSR